MTFKFSRKIAPIILLLFLCINPSLSQYYSTHKFDERNGLKANTIYNIAQDQKGYIWIGSNAGLFRYDGHNFKAFGIENGIVDLDIFNISIDKQNHIILHNFSNNINFLFQNQFHSSKTNPELSTFNFSNLPVVQYNKSLNTIALSESGGHYFFLLKLDNGTPIFNKKFLLHKHENLQQILSMNNLFYVFYNIGNQNDYYYKVFNENSLIDSGSLEINGLTNIESTGNQLCFGKKNILYFYEPTNKNKLSYSHSIKLNHTIKNIFHHNDELWITTIEGGIIRLNSEGVKEHLFPNQSVNNILIDRDSNLWIGTDKNGLFHLKKSTIRNYGMQDLKISNHVMSLSAGNSGEIYLGFDKTSIAKIKNNSIKKFVNLNNKKTPLSRRVTKIACLNNGEVLCGTDENLSLLDQNLTPSHNHSLIQITSVKDVAVLNENEYYVGTSSNLTQIKGNKQKEIYNQRTIALNIDQDTTLWIGTLYGLYYKNKNSNQIYPFDLPLLQTRKINDIISDRHLIYLATDSGICILNKKKKVLNFITKDNGISSNQCNKLAINDSTLWITTYNGLSIVKLTKSGYSTIQQITTDDGLSSNYINDILILNDTAWIATDKGLSMFQVNKIAKRLVSDITITEVKNNFKELNLYQPIQLGPKNNTLSISFSTMSFQHNSSTTFEYKLSPSMDNWTSTSKHTIAFSGLNPSDYIFEVRNTDDRKQIASLQFVVSPTFIQSWYFKVLILGIMICLTLMLFFLRVRQIRRKNHFETTVSQLELEAIKAQINPHFIYNCLNSIKNTIIKKENLKAEEQLSIFAQLVRQTLSISQLNFISIKQEMNYLNNYLEMEKMRHKEKLLFSITTHNIADVSSISIPSMVIQPFVENAIKHGAPEDESLASMIQINFNQFPSYIECNIIDNGPGISHTLNKKNSPHQSEGIKMTTNRAEKYSHLFDTKIEIAITEKKPTGTQVSITFHNK